MNRFELCNVSKTRPKYDENNIYCIKIGNNSFAQFDLATVWGIYVNSLDLIDDCNFTWPNVEGGDFRPVNLIVENNLPVVDYFDGSAYFDVSVGGCLTRVNRGETHFIELGSAQSFSILKMAGYSFDGSLGGLGTFSLPYVKSLQYYDANGAFQAGKTIPGPTPLMIGITLTEKVPARYGCTVKSNMQTLGNGWVNSTSDHTLYTAPIYLLTTGIIDGLGNSKLDGDMAPPWPATFQYPTGNFYRDGIFVIPVTLLKMAKTIWRTFGAWSFAIVDNPNISYISQDYAGTPYKLIPLMIRAKSPANYNEQAFPVSTGRDGSQVHYQFSTAGDIVYEAFFPPGCSPDLTAPDVPQEPITARTAIIPYEYDLYPY